MGETQERPLTHNRAKAITFMVGQVPSVREALGSVLSTSTKEDVEDGESPLGEVNGGTVNEAVCDTGLISRGLVLLPFQGERPLQDRSSAWTSYLQCPELQSSSETARVLEGPGGSCSGTPNPPMVSGGNLGWGLQGVAVLQESCAQREVTVLPTGWGLSSRGRTQRCCYACPLRRKQDPVPGLHCFFLIVPPLSLHPLPSLISNCLNLPLGAQGRSRRLNEPYFLQTRNGGHGNGLVLCVSTTSSQFLQKLRRPRSPAQREDGDGAQDRCWVVKDAPSLLLPGGPAAAVCCSPGPAQVGGPGSASLTAAFGSAVLRTLMSELGSLAGEAGTMELSVQEGRVAGVTALNNSEVCTRGVALSEGGGVRMTAHQGLCPGDRDVGTRPGGGASRMHCPWGTAGIALCWVLIPAPSPKQRWRLSALSQADRGHHGPFPPEDPCRRHGGRHCCPLSPVPQRKEELVPAVRGAPCQPTPLAGEGMSMKLFLGSEGTIPVLGENGVRGGPCPSKGPWLCAGRNSRASHRRVKASLFRGTHSTDRVWAVSGGEGRPQSVGPSRKVRSAMWCGGTGPPPTFWPFAVSLGPVRRLWEGRLAAGVLQSTATLGSAASNQFMSRPQWCVILSMAVPCPLPPISPGCCSRRQWRQSRRRVRPCTPTPPPGGGVLAFCSRTRTTSPLGPGHRERVHPANWPAGPHRPSAPRRLTFPHPPPWKRTALSFLLFCSDAEEAPVLTPRSSHHRVLPCGCTLGQVPGQVSSLGSTMVRCGQEGGLLLVPAHCPGRGLSHGRRAPHIGGALRNSLRVSPHELPALFRAQHLKRDAEGPQSREHRTGQVLQGKAFLFPAAGPVLKVFWSPHAELVPVASRIPENAAQTRVQGKTRCWRASARAQEEACSECGRNKGRAAPRGLPVLGRGRDRGETSRSDKFPRPAGSENPTTSMQMHRKSPVQLVRPGPHAAPAAGGPAGHHPKCAALAQAGKGRRILNREATLDGSQPRDGTRGTSRNSPHLRQLPHELAFLLSLPLGTQRPFRCPAPSTRVPSSPRTRWKLRGFYPSERRSPGNPCGCAAHALVASACSPVSLPQVSLICRPQRLRCPGGGGQWPPGVRKVPVWGARSWNLYPRGSPETHPENGGIQTDRQTDRQTAGPSVSEAASRLCRDEPSLGQRLRCPADPAAQGAPGTPRRFSQDDLLVQVSPRAASPTPEQVRPCCRKETLATRPGDWPVLDHILGLGAVCERCFPESLRRDPDQVALGDATSRLPGAARLSVWRPCGSLQAGEGPKQGLRPPLGEADQLRASCAGNVSSGDRNQLFPPRPAVTGDSKEGPVRVGERGQRRKSLHLPPSVPVSPHTPGPTITMYVWTCCHHTRADPLSLHITRSECRQSGETVDLVSPGDLLCRFCSAMEAFKGKTGKSFLLTIKRRGQRRHHRRPRVACLCLANFPQTLSCSHSLFMRCLRGERGRRRSSGDYAQGVVSSAERLGVPGLGLVTRHRGSFLPKAAHPAGLHAHAYVHAHTRAHTHARTQFLPLHLSEGNPKPITPVPSFAKRRSCLPSALNWPAGSCPFLGEIAGSLRPPGVASAAHRLGQSLPVTLSWGHQADSPPPRWGSQPGLHQNHLEAWLNLDRWAPPGAAIRQLPSEGPRGRGAAGPRKELGETLPPHSGHTRFSPVGGPHRDTCSTLRTFLVPLKRGHRARLPDPEAGVGKGIGGPAKALEGSLLPSESGRVGVYTCTHIFLAEDARVGVRAAPSSPGSLVSEERPQGKGAVGVRPRLPPRHRFQHKHREAMRAPACGGPWAVASLRTPCNPAGPCGARPGTGPSSGCTQFMTGAEELAGSQPGRKTNHSLIDNRATGLLVPPRGARGARGCVRPRAGGSGLAGTRRLAIKVPETSPRQRTSWSRTRQPSPITLSLKPLPGSHRAVWVFEARAAPSPCLAPAGNTFDAVTTWPLCHASARSGGKRGLTGCQCPMYRVVDGTRYLELCSASWLLGVNGATRTTARLQNTGRDKMTENFQGQQWSPERSAVLRVLAGKPPTSSSPAGPSWSCLVSPSSPTTSPLVTEELGIFVGSLQPQPEPQNPLSSPPLGNNFPTVPLLLSSLPTPTPNTPLWQVTILHRKQVGSLTALFPKQVLSCLPCPGGKHSYPQGRGVDPEVDLDSQTCSDSPVLPSTVSLGAPGRPSASGLVTAPRWLEGGGSLCPPFSRRPGPLWLVALIPEPSSPPAARKGPPLSAGRDGGITPRQMSRTQTSAVWPHLPGHGKRSHSEPEQRGLQGPGRRRERDVSRAWGPGPHAHVVAVVNNTLARRGKRCGSVPVQDTTAGALGHAGVWPQKQAVWPTQDQGPSQPWRGPRFPPGPRAQHVSAWMWRFDGQTHLCCVLTLFHLLHQRAEPPPQGQGAGGAEAQRFPPGMPWAAVRTLSHPNTQRDGEGTEGGRAMRGGFKGESKYLPSTCQGAPGTSCPVILARIQPGTRGAVQTRNPGLGSYRPVSQGSMAIPTHNPPVLGPSLSPCFHPAGHEVLPIQLDNEEGEGPSFSQKLPEPAGKGHRDHLPTPHQPESVTRPRPLPPGWEAGKVMGSVRLAGPPASRTVQIPGAAPTEMGNARQKKKMPVEGASAETAVASLLNSQFGTRSLCRQNRGNLTSISNLSQPCPQDRQLTSHYSGNLHASAPRSCPADLGKTVLAGAPGTIFASRFCAWGQEETPPPLLGPREAVEKPIGPDLGVHTRLFTCQRWEVSGSPCRPGPAPPPDDPGGRAPTAVQGQPASLWPEAGDTESSPPAKGLHLGRFPQGLKITALIPVRIGGLQEADGPTRCVWASASLPGAPRGPKLHGGESSCFSCFTNTLGHVLLHLAMVLGLSDPDRVAPAPWAQPAGGTRWGSSASVTIREQGKGNARQVAGNHSYCEQRGSLGRQRKAGTSGLLRGHAFWADKWSEGQQRKVEEAAITSGAGVEIREHNPRPSLPTEYSAHSLLHPFLPALPLRADYLHINNSSLYFLDLCICAALVRAHVMRSRFPLAGLVPSFQGVQHPAPSPGGPVVTVIMEIIDKDEEGDEVTSGRLRGEPVLQRKVGGCPRRWRVKGTHAPCCGNHGSAHVPASLQQLTQLSNQTGYSLPRAAITPPEAAATPGLRPPVPVQKPLPPLQPRLIPKQILTPELGVCWGHCQENRQRTTLMITPSGESVSCCRQSSQVTEMGLEVLLTPSSPLPARLPAHSPPGRGAPDKAEPFLKEHATSLPPGTLGGVQVGHSPRTSHWLVFDKCFWNLMETGKRIRLWAACPSGSNKAGALTAAPAQALFCGGRGVLDRGPDTEPLGRGLSTGRRLTVVSAQVLLGSCSELNPTRLLGWCQDPRQCSRSPSPCVVPWCGADSLLLPLCLCRCFINQAEDLPFGHRRPLSPAGRQVPHQAHVLVEEVGAEVTPTGCLVSFIQDNPERTPPLKICLHVPASVPLSGHIRRKADGSGHGSEGPGRPITCLKEIVQRAWCIHRANTREEPALGLRGGGRSPHPIPLCSHELPHSGRVQARGAASAGRTLVSRAGQEGRCGRGGRRAVAARGPLKPVSSFRGRCAIAGALSPCAEGRAPSTHCSWALSLGPAWDTPPRQAPLVMGLHASSPSISAPSCTCLWSREWGPFFWLPMLGFLQSVRHWTSLAFEPSAHHMKHMPPSTVPSKRPEPAWGRAVQRTLRMKELLKKREGKKEGRKEGRKVGREGGKAENVREEGRRNSFRKSMVGIHAEPVRRRHQHQLRCEFQILLLQKPGCSPSVRKRRTQCWVLGMVLSHQPVPPPGRSHLGGLLGPSLPPGPTRASSFCWCPCCLALPPLPAHLWFPESWCLEMQECHHQLVPSGHRQTLTVTMKESLQGLEGGGGPSRADGPARRFHVGRGKVMTNDLLGSGHPFPWWANFLLPDSCTRCPLPGSSGGPPPRFTGSQGFTGIGGRPLPSHGPWELILPSCGSVRSQGRTANDVRALKTNGTQLCLGNKGQGTRAGGSGGGGQRPRRGGLSGGTRGADLHGEGVQRGSIPSFCLSPPQFPAAKRLLSLFATFCPVSVPVLGTPL
ncbi:hypothetical protein Cadr_000010630 [Camelus dromedarius]|uniref:Uncharacterized protein n=1 Tax=Camelus dromedarius TaxID=9838 RepID=A0A5N4DXF5_CAMDR|nr:hypothetical protein Cadr_000010630 [Camelus dromedarius]